MRSIVRWNEGDLFGAAGEESQAARGGTALRSEIRLGATLKNKGGAELESAATPIAAVVDRQEEEISSLVAEGNVLRRADTSWRGRAVNEREGDKNRRRKPTPSSSPPPQSTTPEPMPPPKAAEEGKTPIDSDSSLLCEDAALNATALSVSNVWSELDGIVKLYPGSMISGGIALYRRQASILTELIRRIAARKEEEEARRLGLRQGQIYSDETETGIEEGGGRGITVTVCETGFGAGHSTALFLMAHPSVRVLTFDKFDRQYQNHGLGYLVRKFGKDRIRSVAGNSCNTVPRTLGSISIWEGNGGANTNNNTVITEGDACDFVHGSSLCQSDNIDLVTHTRCGTVITSTAMDSLSDQDVYFGESAQWRKLRNIGCLRDIVCHEEAPIILDRGYIFAGAGSTVTHKFCSAINAGRCMKDGRGGLRRRMAGGGECLKEGDNHDEGNIDHGGICPRYRVLTPL